MHGRWVQSGQPSLVATCWFVTVTPFLLFSFEPNVDTIFVAGYLVAAYFILQAANHDWDTRTLALAGLAAGQALGTKAVGIVFVPPLLLMTIVAVALRAGPARMKVRSVLVVAATPLVTGGYWYARNALLTGNPLYPLDVRILGRTIWHGWYGPDAMRTSQYYVPLGNWRALVDTLVAVMDPRLVPLWIFALSAGWALAKPVRAGTRRWVASLSLLAVLNVVLFWVFIPYRTQQRFMLQALGLAVVPLAVTLDRLHWLRPIAALLLLLHVLTPESWPLPSREDAIPWDLTPLIPNAIGPLMSLYTRLELVLRSRAPMTLLLSVGSMVAICASAVIVVWAWDRVVSSPSRRLRKSLIAVAATALFLVLGYLDVRPQPIDSRFEFYPLYPDFIHGWLALEARSGPSGARVAYAGTNLPYYLMGSRLRNEVCYINVDRHRDWLLHDYHYAALERGQGNWPDSRPGWDRIRPDLGAWLENLEAEGIQLLVVTRVNPAEGLYNLADSEGFPIERTWADSHPDRFELVYGGQENDRRFRLYRLRPRAAPGSGVR